MTLIAIDTSFLAHQSMHAMGSLEADSVPSGVVFGILSRALQLAIRHRSHHLVFCFDSQKSVRTIRFPEYRAARRTADKTPEEVAALKAMHVQLDDLRERLLPQIGWPCLLSEGFEADDLLAAVAGSYGWRSWDRVGSSTIDRSKKGVKTPVSGRQTPPDASYAAYEAGIGALPGRCVLVTRDHDLFQCLRAGSVIMDDMSGKPWCEGRFREEYGIDPAQWMMVKAIGGCTSDGIPGCAPGIGEGRALAYLKNELNVEGRWFRLICQNTDSVNNTHSNMKLVRLPHEDFPGVTLPHPLHFSKQGFIDVCEEYNLASFLKPDRLSQWRKVFKGEWELL